MWGCSRVKQGRPMPHRRARASAKSRKNLRKQRQEIEDYEYKENLERKKALDKYEEDLRL